MRAKTLQVSLGVLAALLVSATNSKAATATFDFNTDPTGTAGFFFGGSAEWRQTGGVNDSGFLLITPAANSQSGGILFPDFDAGLVVAAFTFECKIKMGDWTGAACPADGFSLSYARATDEAIPNLEGGGNGVYAGSQDNGGTENNLPEEGTQTGIGIGFDTWGTGDAPQCGENGPGDLRGISVRVDGKQVAQIGMPALVIADETAYATNCTTLMTGPRDAVDPGSGSRLAWVPLKVTVDASGKVNVFWKGCQIVTDLPSAYFPSPGRLVFGGRTGGANSFAGVDDIKITTVPAVGETEPPTVPGNFKAVTVGARRVQLTWDPSTERPDPSVQVRYRVEKNGQLLSTYLANTTYEDRAVSPATQYTYRVLATDILGNESAFAPAVVVTTGAEVAGPAYLLGEIYDGISGTPVDNLYADPKFPASPDRGVYLNGLSFGETSNFGNTFGDNFGIRIAGTLTPPVTGQYDFFVRSDDASQFFLNTADANIPVPGVDLPIAEETGCCNGFFEPGAAQTTATPKDLQAGKEYGFLYIVKEGGGGDWGQVAWRIVGDPTPAGSLQPIRGAFVKGRGDPTGASVSITQPPSNATVAENSTVTFTVVATGVSPYGAPVVYHWHKNGVPIFGANSSSYTTPLLKKADNGAKYKVLVAVPGASAFSTEAALTVTDDVTPPTITKVTAVTEKTVTVSFSEPVTSATAGVAGNYSIPGLTVQAATVVNATTVNLTTSAQAPGTSYTLTASNVRDTASAGGGNAIAAPGNTATFKSLYFAAGVLHKFWDNITQNNIAGLTGNSRFPDNPTFSSIEPRWEYGPNGSNESGSNYGNQLSGWFTPAQSGDYIFFTNSDDPSNLYLSTDESPANKKLIAQETGWSDARNWVSVGSGDVTAKRSDSFAGSEWPTPNVITLVAGKKYYMESLHTEGGGGDSVGATFIMAGEADPVNGDAPKLAGALVGVYLDPDTGPPVITKSPTVPNVPLGGNATLGPVEASIGEKPVTYQWQFGKRIDQLSNIAGATGDTLTVQNLGLNNVGFYRVTASNAQGAASSQAVLLAPSGTLFIEAEDFNYDSGNYVTGKPIGMTGPYPGGDFRDLGSDADNGIDWNANGNGGQPYRDATGVDAGKQNQHADGLPRGTFDVTVNHVVGWNDGGEWQNYTRQFPTPAAAYHVIGRLSSGGAAIHAQLDEVTAGAKTANQTLKKLGEFNPGRSTANWDIMEFFTLEAYPGEPAIVGLGGERTIRLTILPGAEEDQDYFMFIPIPGVAADTTAPTVPGNLRVSQALSRVVALEWNASTDTSGRVGYEVARDGTVLGMTAGTTFVDLGAEPSKNYTYTVQGIDPSLNKSASASVTASTPQAQQVSLAGMLTFEAWYGIGGTPVADLLADARYPDSPSFVALTPAFNTRPVFPDDSHNNYGGRIRGWITPTETADYDFFLRSDDASELWLSTDETAANLQKIAEETGCCNAFTEPPSARTTAAPKHLEANKRYYVQAIWKEGGGGDYCQVAWRKVGDTTAAGSLIPIPAQFLSTVGDPTIGPPAIAKALVAPSPALGSPATIGPVEIAAGYAPFTYQWQFGKLDGQWADIAGATSAKLDIASVGVDQIGFYRVNVRNAYATTVRSTSANRPPLLLVPSGTLFIEAEDFNYGGGNYVQGKPIGVTGPYPGGDFRDLGSSADSGIDWNASDNAGQTYRTPTSVAAGKENAHANGLLRGTFNVTQNHVVGWNDPGEWYNYTRQFPTPAAAYKVVGRLASGGNAIRAQLDEVTAGAKTASQTLAKIGEFNPGRNTASWDTLEFFPLVDDSGNLATANLGGERTVRITTSPGAAVDFDYFMFIPAGAAPPEQPRITKIEFQANGDLLVEWTGGGTLEYTDKLGPGPITWTPVTGAPSPILFPKASLGPMNFARIRK